MKCCHGDAEIRSLRASRVDRKPRVVQQVPELPEAPLGRRFPVRPTNRKCVTPDRASGTTTRASIAQARGSLFSPRLHLFFTLRPGC